MSSQLTGIHPTRLELLKLRHRRTLAEGIIDILEKDLEALMTSLFEFLKKIQNLQILVVETLKEVYSLFIEAEMIAGARKIEEIAFTIKSEDFILKVGSQSGVLGIQLPSFSLIEEKKDTIRHHVSMLDAPAKLDESFIKTWEAISLIIKRGETEASIREILEVISIKRRQVNRLQYKVLPQLDKMIRYIELILEETERQDTIRVRVLQRKRKERALGSP